MKKGPNLLLRNKLPEELKLKYRQFLESKAPLTAMMRDIHRMDCYQFYESLNEELKLKCINEREKNLVFIDKPESLAYLDESTAANEGEIDE